MGYPLIERELLSYLRLAHGIFNFSVMLMFLYQGWLGFTIRRARRVPSPLPLRAITRHRAFGPVLTLLGGSGFCAGLALVLLSTGNILEHPPHFFAGTLIAVLLIATYWISRNIKGTDSPLRTPHFILGIAIVCLYLVNALLGIGVLL